ncbi:MAG: hypothetical protein R2710_13980 [Acidimicrobiales bacterium]
MLRVLPMAAFIVLIVGIIVFTAYARTPGTAITTTTFRGPDIGIDPGACVRRLPDAGLLALPCDGNEDGVLIAVTLPGATCPEGTEADPAREGWHDGLPRLSCNSGAFDGVNGDMPSVAAITHAD